MAGAGIAWARYDFNWFQIEPAKGTFDWSATDAAVDAAVARGLNVYATLAYTPQWASGVTCTTDSTNPATLCQPQVFISTSDWTDFVTAAVGRYHDRVKVWGMWNEPNLGGFWLGSEQDYVQKVLVPGSAAVHAACADCRVGGPETSGLTASSTWNGSHGVCAFGACIRNGWELDLSHVLDDAGASIDVVTQHFYNNDAQAEAVGQLADGEFFGTTMTHDSLRDVLLAHGAAGKPVWLTETGRESINGSSEAAQATFLTELLTAREELMLGTYAPAVHQPFQVEKIFLYDLKDGASDGWGLLRADGSEKPSYAAVKQYIAGHAGTPTPTPSATPSGTPTATPTPSTPSPTPTVLPGDNISGGHGGCEVGGGPFSALPLAAVAGMLALFAASGRRRR